MSEIAGLFDAQVDQVQVLNNITNSSQILEENREVLLPIKCFCSGGFFESELNYTIPSTSTYTEIACDVFEGLVKVSTIAEENPYDANNVTEGLKLSVPLNCACPDTNDTNDGLQYLVSYPIKESDDPRLIAKKFSIPLDDLFAQNSQGADATLFPNTTILVPLRNVPSIDLNVSDTSDRDPGFTPFTPSEIVQVKVNKKISYVIGAVIGLFSLFVALFGLSLYLKAKQKRSVELELSSARPSTSSCLSPNLVAVVSKYSLTSYAVEELRKATKGFSEDNQLSASVHKGRIGDTDLVIKKIGYCDARRTIGIHSRINHAAIVKLEGVCYGVDEFSSSFLVFEFALNGCLRDCLRNSMKALSWKKRIQIALDVATGLHYIHHCTIPSYIHMNITSRNILITEDWTAKIANLGANSVINFSKEEIRNVAVTSEGWIAPEYLRYGRVSTKVDVFAFGVVLFELLSAKEVRGWSFLKENLCFLSRGGGVTDCFDELRRFLDPNLSEYPVGDVLCMTVLAKGCVEEDPTHRPSMNDILKILTRLVR